MSDSSSNEKNKSDEKSERNYEEETSDTDDSSSSDSDSDSSDESSSSNENESDDSSDEEKEQEKDQSDEAKSKKDQKSSKTRSENRIPVLKKRIRNFHKKEDKPNNNNVNEKPKYTFDFVYPPKDKNVEITAPKGKDDEIKEAKLIIRKWVYGSSSLYYQENDKKKLDSVLIAVNSLYYTYKKLPPTLMVSSKDEIPKIIKFLNKNSKLKICVVSKEDLDKDLLKACIVDIKDPNKYNVFLISKDLFITDAALIPTGFPWASVVYTDVILKTTKVQWMFKRTKSYEFYAVILASSNLKSSIRISLLSTIKLLTDKGKYERNKDIISNLAPFFINSSSDTLESLIGEIKQQKSVERNYPDVVQEENILCPMNEYQFTVYKTIIYKARPLLLSGNADAADFHDICSDLLTACHHPIMINKSQNPASSYGKMKSRHSGKLFVLANIINSKKDEKIVIIAEDGESAQMISVGLEQYGITSAVIRDENKDMLESIVKESSSKTNPIVAQETLFKDVTDLYEPTTLINYDSYINMLVNKHYNKWKKISRIRLLTSNAADFAFHSQLYQFIHYTIEQILDEDHPRFARLNSILRYCINNLLDIPVHALRSTKAIKTRKIIVSSSRPGFPSIEKDLNFSNDFFEKIFNQQNMKDALEPIKYELAQKKEAQKKEESNETAPKKNSSRRKTQKASELEFEIPEWSDSEIFAVINHLMNYGNNRFEKLKIDHDQNEIESLINYIFHTVNQNDKIQNYFYYSHLILEKFDYNTKEYLSVFQETIRSLTRGIGTRKFLINFELALILDHLSQTNFEDHKKKAFEAVPPNAKWEYEDDLAILKDAYELGYKKFPLSPKYSGNYRLKCYLHRLLIVLYIKIRGESLIKLTTGEQRYICDMLVFYGYPSDIEFLEYIDETDLDPQAVLNTINTIIDIAHEQNPNTRNALNRTLPEKIQKYHMNLIISRLDDFDYMRENMKLLSRICAEDLELFRAFDRHGINCTYVSPVFMCQTGGYASNVRLKHKLKGVLRMETHDGRQPFDYSGQPLDKLLPLKLSDMIMLENLGDITGCCDEYAVYPDGYKVTVIAPSLDVAETFIFVTERIEIHDDDPWFIIEAPSNNRTVTFEGETPDECWEKYRCDIEIKTKLQLPLFDGYEMFGFTSPIYHKIMHIALKGKMCKRYVRRTFRDISYKFSREKLRIGYYPSEEETAGQNKIERKRNTGMCFKMDLSPLMKNDTSMLIISPPTIDTFGSLMDLYFEDNEMPEPTL